MNKNNTLLKIGKLLNIIFFLTLLFTNSNLFAQSFNHPGILNTREELDLIKNKIKSGEQPWKQAFEELQKSSFAQLPYSPKAAAITDCGSYNKDANGHTNPLCNTFVDDPTAAYTSTLIWYMTNDARYASNAINIINAWTNVYQSNIGSNAVLNVSWATPFYVNAAELLRYGNGQSNSGWSAADMQKFNNMLTKFLTYVKREDIPGNNWVQSAIESHMAIAVYTDNRNEFNNAVNRWKTRVKTYIYQSTDGATPLIYPSGNLNPNASTWSRPGRFIDGLSMETCRDLGHMNLGFRSMMYAAQIAWEQGVDLFSGEQKRLTDFMELHAGWMTGSSAVPTFLNSGLLSCSGQTNSPVAPNCGSPAWEIAYNHLHSRLKKNLPQTLKMINSGRPVRAGGWVSKWETLTHGNLPSEITNPIVAVTGITLSPASTTIQKGNTTQLTTTITPTNATNKFVTYSSSNIAVATVSGTGLVTAIAAGTATIRVITADGNKSSTSTITVTNPVVAVSGVTLSPGSVSVKKGETIQLAAAVSPANATNKAVQYSSSNNTVASVSATGLLTAINAGNCIITVTTSDGAKKATSTVTITSPPLNQLPQVSYSSIVSPNSFTAPASLKVVVNASDADGTISGVDLYINNTFIRKETTTPFEWNYSVNDIPLSNLVAGSYILKAVATDNTGATSEVIRTITILSITNNDTCKGNTAPVISITSPANNSVYLEGSSVTIQAAGSDNDKITQVQFFNGTQSLGIVKTAPFSITLPNLFAGSYTITAVASDNCMLKTTSAPIKLTINSSANPTEIIGADCSGANKSVVYELAPTLRTNATAYSWWFSGSQSTATTLAQTPYKSTIVFSNYYSGGNICVGVNYSTTPYYKSYCKPVGVCNGKTDGLIESENYGQSEILLYPNPSTSGTLSIQTDEVINKIEVLSNLGILIKQFSSQGSLDKISTTDLNNGVYFLRITTPKNTILKVFTIDHTN